MRSLIPLTIGASISVVVLLYYFFRKKTSMESQVTDTSKTKHNGVIKMTEDDAKSSDVLPKTETVKSEEAPVALEVLPKTETMKVEEAPVTLEVLPNTESMKVEEAPVALEVLHKIETIKVEEAPVALEALAVKTKEITISTEQPAKPVDLEELPISVTTKYSEPGTGCFAGKVLTDATDSQIESTPDYRNAVQPEARSSDSEQCSEKSEVSLPEADQRSMKSDSSLPEDEQRTIESSPNSPKSENSLCCEYPTVAGSTNQTPVSITSNGDLDSASEDIATNGIDKLEHKRGNESKTASKNGSDSNASIITKSSSGSITIEEASTEENISKKSEEDVSGVTDASIPSNINNANQESMQAVPIQRYYENHYYPLIEENINGSNKYDYRNQWPQPLDDCVFVPAVEGQPLVPSYLRDPQYLATRTIPTHSTSSVAHMYTLLPALVHAPLLWVRVLSVSTELQLRVRQDQRDMLFEQAEETPLCDPSAPSPVAKSVKVGSLVAAELKHPRRGQLWCRVRVTHIKDLARTPNGHKVPRYSVESVDHYSEIPEPVLLPLNSIRALNQHGLSMPFYDQLVYLKNILPKNKQVYNTEAREQLLKMLRVNSNFLYIAAPAPVCVDGVVYWIADPVFCQDNQNMSLTSLLTTAGLSMPIFHGMVTPDTCFDNCMFRDGDAYWAHDRRKLVRRGAAVTEAAHMQYVFVVTFQGSHTAYGGFQLPYKHLVGGFRTQGFNVTLSELLTLFSRQHKYDRNLRRQLEIIRTSSALKMNVNISVDTLMAFYISDVEQMGNPECLVVYGNNTVVPSAARRPIVFPKDNNGFLFVDLQTGVCRKVSELRHPIV